MATEAQAASVREAIIEDYNRRRSPGLKIPMPQGMLERADEYAGAPHPGEDSTLILGNAGRFLKNPKPGLYIWRKRDDPRTGALVASMRMTPVTMDEIDRTNDDVLAVVSAHKTPSGDYVMWETLALFHMDPKNADRYYYSYEKYAKGRLAARAAQWEEEIETASQGAYKGIAKKGLLKRDSVS
jgi:hypothetical protein